MSAPPDTNTEVIVYVRLLDEGTGVWRLVPAADLPDGAFKLAEPDVYDRDTETWEFPPHARVRCVSEKFADGDKALVAVAQAE